MNFGFLSLLLISSSIVTVFPMTYAFLKRKKHISFAIMSGLLLAMAIWSFANGMEIAAVNLELKRVINVVAYIGIVSVPPLWFLFSFAYSETGSWIRFKTVCLLFLIPVTSLILLTTNDLHNLFYLDYFIVESGDYLLFGTEVGPYWNYVHLIYSGGLVIAGFVMMTARMIKVQRRQIKNILQMIFAASLPIIGNILFLAGVKPYGFLDITPFTFILSAFIFLNGSIKHKLFDVIPVAMESLYDAIPNEVFVFDSSGELVSYNVYAKKAMLSESFTEKLFSDSFIKTDYSGEKEIEINNRVFIASKTPLGKIPDKKEGVLIVLNDITKLRESQRKVDYLSYHDHLTGLYNRRYLDYAIKKYDRKENLPLSVISIDVNGLKLMNDAFGHSAGDELLKETAYVLNELKSDKFIPARTGGDEFLVLLPCESEKELESIISEIYKLSGTRKVMGINLSVAIGFATKNEISENINDIIEEADNEMYKKKIRTKKSSRLKILDVVMNTLFTDYIGEKKHFDEVARITKELSGEIGLAKHEIITAVNAAYVHDVGKIIIPKEVLYKSPELTQKEKELYKRHPDAGYQILKSIDDFVHLAEIVLYHHERWDGKGYPVGLKGDEIPIESRIIAIADAYDAMVSGRYSKQAVSPGDAKAEILKNAGTQFDPEIARIFTDKY